MNSANAHEHWSSAFVKFEIGHVPDHLRPPAERPYDGPTLAEALGV